MSAINIRRVMFMPMPLLIRYAMPLLLSLIFSLPRAATLLSAVDAADDTRAMTAMLL